MEDNRLKEIKNDYENIRVPKELRQKVENTIRLAKEDSEKEFKQMKKEKKIVFVKRVAGGVVAAMAAITCLVNSGSAIAYAMYEIPVLGNIAEVVTFREYKNHVNYMEANVAVPEISVKDTEGEINQESTVQMNKSIEEYTSEIIKQFEADVEASGGSEMLDLKVDYSIVTDNARLFSLRFDNTVVMAGGSQSVKIYHMDKQTGEMINLAGIFKENVNYITPISENIKEQMKAQMELDESIYYWLEDEIEECNFKEIAAEPNFYVNDAGKLVIVFDEYEVAPGYMGVVEFEIPTEAVQDLVHEGFLN